jgi:hypothetical protein
VNISSALLINMGTLQSDWLAAKKLATKQVCIGPIRAVALHTGRALRRIECRIYLG